MQPRLCLSWTSALVRKLRAQRLGRDRRAILALRDCMTVRCGDLACEGLCGVRASPAVGRRDEAAVPPLDQDAAPPELHRLAPVGDPAPAGAVNPAAVDQVDDALVVPPRVGLDVHRDGVDDDLGVGRDHDRVSLDGGRTPGAERRTQDREEANARDTGEYRLEMDMTNPRFPGAARRSVTRDIFATRTRVGPLPTADHNASRSLANRPVVRLLPW